MGRICGGGRESTRKEVNKYEHQDNSSHTNLLIGDTYPYLMTKRLQKTMQLIAQLLHHLYLGDYIGRQPWQPAPRLMWIKGLRMKLKFGCLLECGEKDYGKSVFPEKI